MIRFILILFLISCNQIKENEEIKVGNSANEIVFIFKKNISNGNNNSNVTNTTSDVYYTEFEDFEIIELNVNRNKTDTIVEKINKNKICLNHLFDKTKRYIYEFKKGDTVVFDYVKNKPIVTIKNRKNLQYDNNFLHDISIDKPLDEIEFIIKNKRPRNKLENKDYLIKLEKYNFNLDKALDSILNKNLISNDIYELHKSSNKYYQFNTNKELMINVKANDLRKDNLIFLKTYRYFLSNFIVYKYNLIPKDKSNPLSCDPKKAFDLIATDNIYSLKIKEYLLYTYLEIIYQNYNLVEFNNYLEKFKNITNNNYLIDRISKKYVLKYNDTKNISDEIYFLNNDYEILTFDKIQKSFDKVVYIDFWASWCAPCRASFPASRKLHEKYKKKDIEFVYISIDKNFEAWQKAHQKELLDNKYSFLATNYPEANFYKENQLKSIPRYMIFHNGKLVNNNAPSPDSPEIEKELEKYLSKK
jgi:thiol-disulfide isomerase/thioredoxin